MGSKGLGVDSQEEATLRGEIEGRREAQRRAAGVENRPHMYLVLVILARRWGLGWLQVWQAQCPC